MRILLMDWVDHKYKKRIRYWSDPMKKINSVTTFRKPDPARSGIRIGQNPGFFFEKESQPNFFKEHKILNLATKNYAQKNGNF